MRTAKGAKQRNMVIDNTWYNVDYWKGKTFKDFCEHEAHLEMSKEKMKEVWDLIQKPQKPETVEKTEP